LSLPSYVIAAFHRDDARSTEAGLKYFVLGALSSGMLLYGASLVYGFTGTISFPGIAAILQGQGAVSSGIVFGLVFLAAGMAFKISAVPFHMWTPDVYEGSPTPVGSFAAIGQRNLKRLMAYSSIANVGYALIGLAAGTPEGIQGVAIYMAIYLAMTLGAFACILALRRGNLVFETVDDLSGIARTHPVMAFCLATMMFSLAGIPPLAGFFAKFYVFAAAIQANLVTLAVVGVVTSVIGAYYYLRIVKVMYFDEPKDRFEPMPLGVKIVLAASSAFVLVFGIVPGPLVSAAGAAARSLFS
jgi:NADH-quinone oxidoreductase subunit N